MKCSSGGRFNIHIRIAGQRARTSGQVAIDQAMNAGRYDDITAMWCGKCGTSYGGLKRKAREQKEGQ